MMIVSAGQMQRVSTKAPTSSNSGFWQRSQSQIAHGKKSGAPKKRATTMMPVSVPKVLVRPPGQRTSEWMDLWEAYVSLMRLVHA